MKDEYRDYQEMLIWAIGDCEIMDSDLDEQWKLFHPDMEPLESRKELSYYFNKFYYLYQISQKWEKKKDEENESSFINMCRVMYADFLQFASRSFFRKKDSGRHNQRCGSRHHKIPIKTNIKSTLKKG